MKITVVVGNPTSRSRTLGAAAMLAEAVASHFDLPDVDLQSIDLALHAGEIFEADSKTFEAIMQRVKESRLVVFATPTYKASYTGLLKALLDRYETNGLTGVIGIPMMTGGTARHALAVEVHLRPVLVELDISVPARGLFVLTAELEQLDETIEGWIRANDRPLRLALAG